MIKILIADDQELIRQSLQIILDSEKDFEVTDAVANGVEVIRSIRKERPDVILMDIRMPEMDGVVCTQIIKENYPDIRIIILNRPESVSDTMGARCTCGHNIGAFSAKSQLDGNIACRHIGNHPGHHQGIHPVHLACQNLCVFRLHNA